MGEVSGVRDARSTDWRESHRSRNNASPTQRIALRTKTERRVTILLPKWVAEHDTEREVFLGSCRHQGVEL
jgi:hypothetical protein